MYERDPPRIRSDEYWEEIRRAWEGGATGASLAKRYDVGLANLWRRRAEEAWERKPAPDPVPEPVEGWERFAEKQRDAFELRLTETRMVATKLAEAMAGGGLEGVPLWHLGFVLKWREENLTAETGARDRDWARRYGWTAGMWDAAGRLEPLMWLDGVTLHANREAWREEAGLPEGAAEDWP
jgi:transposase-like protein